MSTPPFKERFARMLHPYIIVLRQGGKRPNDLFDFSLALLHRHSGETLPRPSPNMHSSPSSLSQASQAALPQRNTQIKTTKATTGSRKKKDNK